MDSPKSISRGSQSSSSKAQLTPVEPSEDVWNIAYIEPERWPFVALNIKQKAFAVSFGILKVALLLAILYVFIISLGMLGSGFLILGGTTAGLTFRNNAVFDNPFAGTVIGILATVLVQSSSTSTSIIISMTAAGLLKVDHAVFMVMGANIGTSITNTIVALAQVHDKNQFRRAFGGATVHDMFNFLSVSILLPVEWATGILRRLAEVSVKSLSIPEGYEAPNFIKLLTKPATSKIMSVDKGLIKKIGQEKNTTILKDLLQQSIVKWSKCKDEKTRFVYCAQQDKMSDGLIGFTLTLWAILLLCISLILIVKLLNYSLKGTTARFLQKWINVEFKPPFGWVADYLLLLFGIGLTILAQSSSVTTSSLTPLVGIGLLRINKMFPITLGANVGTTTTGIMAAMGSSELVTALTVAFCHLYFNVFGILIWFIIPQMRAIPIAMAIHMGNVTAEFRWFAAAYVLVAFVFVPMLLLGLSLAGPIPFGVIMGPIIILSLIHLIVVTLRDKNPKVLPEWLVTYYWLPGFCKKEPECLKEYHRRMVSKAEELERKTTEKKLRRDAGEDLTLVDRIYMCLGDGTWPADPNNTDIQNSDTALTEVAVDTGTVPFNIQSRNT